MMEIPGAKNDERRKAGDNLIHELLHTRARREAAQARAPRAGIAPLEAEGREIYGVVEVEVNCQAPQSTRR